MNSKTKIGSMFLLAAVLVAGTISMIVPKALAEPEYYGYEEKYAKDPYGKDHNKYYKGVSIQTIKCVNSNVNINGVNVNQVPEEPGAAAALQEDSATNGNGNGLFGDGGLNIDRNLVNICVNVNLNGQAEGFEEALTEE